MIMLDGDHGQGFINSIGKDMINTNHAYFEKKINMQTKLGLTLEVLNSAPCHHLTYLV